MRVVLRGCAVCLGGRSGSRNAGRPRAALPRMAAGSAEDLRARARTWAAVSRRRGECLYLRRNCPLNACLRFRGILIYLRYKHTVYARFRGCFAAVQKIAPENAGTLCGAVGTLRRWAALVGLEARRSYKRSEYLQGCTSSGWSWRHSTEPETEKSPGRLRAYRGGCLLGAFRRVNEYQERHEQNI